MYGPRPTMPTMKGPHEPSIIIDYSDDMAGEDESISDLPIRLSSRYRPEASRSRTEPGPAALLQGWVKERELHDRPRSSGASSSSSSSGKSHHRNRSPYSRNYHRARSTSGPTLSAPLMTRAHSMPNPHTPRPFDTAPNSGTLSPTPLRSPARARSPFKLEEGAYNPPPRSPSWFDMSSGIGMGIEAIQEDSELDITPRALPHSQASSNSASFSRSNSLRSSRRPASPLHLLSNVAPSASAPTTPSFPASVIDHNAPLHHSSQPATSRSSPNSPAINPQKYNEAYPTSLSLHHYASNSSFSSFSMPSTPTSARSRSPSISSLETIEDAPERESEAEAEAIERLKLAAESESDGESEGGTRRRSLDVPRAGRRTGLGLGLGGERKRWSICGGERRGDLDLETIWED